MDTLLNLILPDSREIEALEKHQSVYELDGISYPQDDILYKWGQYVNIVPDKVQPHFLKFLPENYVSPTWTWWQVKEPAIDLYQREINGEKVEWFGKRLDDLLVRVLTQHSNWVVIFALHYEQIDDTCKLSVNECINRLKTTLDRKWDKKGFIAYA